MVSLRLPQERIIAVEIFRGPDHMARRRGTLGFIGVLRNDEARMPNSWASSLVILISSFVIHVYLATRSQSLPAHRAGRLPAAKRRRGTRGCRTFHPAWLWRGRAAL